MAIATKTSGPRPPSRTGGTVNLSYMPSVTAPPPVNSGSTGVMAGAMLPGATPPPAPSPLRTQTPERMNAPSSPGFAKPDVEGRIAPMAPGLAPGQMPAARTALDSSQRQSTGTPGAPAKPSAYDEWMSTNEQAQQALQAQVQQRVDAIGNQTMAQMRQAAGVAGMMGRSFGGGFADSQRQVGIQGMQLQDQARAEGNLTAQQMMMQRLGVLMDQDRFDRGFNRDQTWRDEDINRADSSALGAAAGDAASLLSPSQKGFYSDKSFNEISPGEKEYVRTQMEVDAANGTYTGKRTPEAYYDWKVNQLGGEAASSSKMQGDALDKWLPAPIKALGITGAQWAAMTPAEQQAVIKKLSAPTGGGVQANQFGTGTFNSSNPFGS